MSNRRAAAGAPAFAAWLDQFFDSYYRYRPVNATFVGVHAYDDRLPDYSEQGMAAVLGDAQAQLERLEALPAENLSASEALDGELARGFLEIQRWESRSAHFGFPLANPSLVTGEAIFGVLGVLLRAFAPVEQRLEMAAARLWAVPALLDGALSNLRPAPLAWVERARRECAGAQRLLDGGIDTLLHDTGIEHERLRRAARSASEAFARFDAYLEREVLPRATGDYACGGEAFDLLLRRAHFLEVDADELERFALETLEAARMRSATDGARAAPAPSAANVRPTVPGAQVGPAVPGAQVRPAVPDAGAGRVATGPNVDAVRRCGELWQASRRLAEDAELLTCPDWPVNFVEQPRWVREAAPALYFLPYRAPAPFDPTPVTECFVPQRADESTIKLNYVLHHASLGHHVQNWFAARADSRIGRVAAVDCASRIALLCGGSMAEGWACYAVDLARDAGFLTPAETAEHERTRLRLAARAVVDIRLHHGRFSLDQAADFYQQHAGLLRTAAQAEAVKNSLFPGAACMYLVGWDGLWRLRRETQAREGGAFSLRTFHDRVLSFGSVPVTLIAQAMRASGKLAVHAHR
jgi:uncharacterized protein (DUF885 family)